MLFSLKRNKRCLIFSPPLSCLAIPIKCFIFHYLTGPFFFETVKKKKKRKEKNNSRFTSQRSKNFNSQAHNLLIIKTKYWCDVVVFHLHQYCLLKTVKTFDSHFNIHLLPSDYISYILNIRFHMQKLENNFNFFFCPVD